LQHDEGWKIRTDRPPTLFAPLFPSSTHKMFFSALVSPRHRSSSAPPAPPTDSQPAPAVPPPPLPLPPPHPLPPSLPPRRQATLARSFPLCSPASFIIVSPLWPPPSSVRSCPRCFHPIFCALPRGKQGERERGRGKRKRRTKRAAAVVNFFAGCFIGPPALPTIFITCFALAEPPNENVSVYASSASQCVCVCECLCEGCSAGQKRESLGRKLPRLPWQLGLQKKKWKSMQLALEKTHLLFATNGCFCTTVIFSVAKMHKHTRAHIYK